MVSEDVGLHILDILDHYQPDDGDWLILNEHFRRTGLTQPDLIRNGYAYLEHKKWAECLPNHQQIFLAPEYKAKPNGEKYLFHEAVTLENSTFKARLTRAGEEESTRRKIQKVQRELLEKQNRAFDPADKRSRTSLLTSKIALVVSVVAIGLTLYRLWLDKGSARLEPQKSTTPMTISPETALIRESVWATCEPCASDTAVVPDKM